MVTYHVFIYFVFENHKKKGVFRFTFELSNFLWLFSLPSSSPSLPLSHLNFFLYFLLKFFVLAAAAIVFTVLTINNTDNTLNSMKHHETGTSYKDLVQSGGKSYEMCYNILFFTFVSFFFLFTFNSNNSAIDMRRRMLCDSAQNFMVLDLFLSCLVPGKRSRKTKRFFCCEHFVFFFVPQ